MGGVLPTMNRKIISISLLFISAVAMAEECREYKIDSYLSGANTGWHESKEAACAALVAQESWVLQCIPNSNMSFDYEHSAGGWQRGIGFDFQDVECEICEEGDLYWHGEIIPPGEDAFFNWEPPELSSGNCQLMPVLGQAGCGDHTNEDIVNSPMHGKGGHFEDGSYGINMAYCSTGEPAMPTAEGFAPFDEDPDHPVPYTNEEEPHSESNVTPITETTEPDGTVVEEQTEYTAEYGRKLEEFKASEGYAASDAEIAEYSYSADGDQITEIITTVETQPDGTIVETVQHYETVVEPVEYRRELKVPPTEGDPANDWYQTGGGSSTTLTTTTTTKNPDGSTSSNTTQEEVESSPGGGGSGSGGDGDCAGPNCEGEGSGRFEGSGLGGVRTFGESWGALEGAWNGENGLGGQLAGVVADIPDGGTCPTTSFDAFEETYTLDVQCLIMDEYYSLIRALFLMLFALMAIFVVLKV